MVPFPDVSKLSAVAAHLEQRYPNASIGEIYAMAKPTVENAIAVQVAGGNRNNRSSLMKKILILASTVLLRGPQFGESISRNSFSPVISRRPSFNQDQIVQIRGSPSRSSRSQQQVPPQQLPLPDTHTPTGTPSYDLDSWFGPIATQSVQPQSSSQAHGVSQFQVYFLIIILSGRTKFRNLEIHSIVQFTRVQDMYVFLLR